MSPADKTIVVRDSLSWDKSKYPEAGKYSVKVYFSYGDLDYEVGDEYQVTILEGVNPLSVSALTQSQKPRLMVACVPGAPNVQLSASVAFSEIQVYDAAGKSVLKQVVGENTQRYTLDVSSLKSDTYLIRVVTEQGEITGKFRK